MSYKEIIEKLKAGIETSNWKIVAAVYEELSGEQINTPKQTLSNQQYLLEFLQGAAAQIEELLVPIPQEKVNQDVAAAQTTEFKIEDYDIDEDVPPDPPGMYARTAHQLPRDNPVMEVNCQACKKTIPLMKSDYAELKKLNVEYKCHFCGEAAW